MGLFPKQRIKLRVYLPLDFRPKVQSAFVEIKPTYLRSAKAQHPAYQLYVNSRPLLRKFREFKNNPFKFISQDLVSPYMAGRFDGDGSVAADFHRDCRIVYSKFKEAKNDLQLMRRIGFQEMKIYHYQKAPTFCLYVYRLETNKFFSSIYPFSLRLKKSVFVPRRDLANQLEFDIKSN